MSNRRFYAGRFVLFVIVFSIAFLLAVVVTFVIVSAPPEPEVTEENTINDVTTLNPIRVGQIKQPTKIAEIQALVKNHRGPISIGGARHSMGGQIGADSSLHLDMRKFNKIISLSKEAKEITVQTGITWRKIQEYIDPLDLSVMIMQTYSNFTVGGSLSVNVHGRYIGHGPIIHSIKSIKVVLANGDLVTASLAENSELFSGCIGGYGGLGVIVEATLKLEDNCRVERQSKVMDVADYPSFFPLIRDDSTVVFHNGDLYPNGFERVRAVSYVKTTRPVTIANRLMPDSASYRFERFGIWLISEVPGGKWFRQYRWDPELYSEERIEWRNFEASYDAAELEPTSRKNSTYVLQEYFIPVKRFNSFVPKMTSVFKEHDVNVINVSIRHARPDTVSLLNWAPVEVFCFVIYYKQGITESDKQEVGSWTRELIDAALAEGGSYYLPYQLHATREQFRRAYPRADKFFELKKRVDPANKFRNKMWDKLEEKSASRSQKSEGKY